MNHILQTQNPVINWHLLEPCQLNCKYCYAEWAKANLPEIYKDSQQSKLLVQEIASLKNDYDSLRLSFAGGEPLLDKKLSEKIHLAYVNGLLVSIITNGDLLKPEELKLYASKLSILGVSIDSCSDETNLKIGRATISGKLPDYNKIIDLLSLARDINPLIEIKINTVVNRFNYMEDMSRLIDKIQPDKWKVLRVLPATKKAKVEAIDNAQYEQFYLTHNHIAAASFENNDDMENSYLMIDPYGRFFFNQSNHDYGYSLPILDVGIQKALKQVCFDESKFNKRYMVIGNSVTKVNK